jgi:hypothetical protein
VTVAIERLGGVVGGFLGTLPTTIVPAALGILAGSATTVGFQDAMGAVPVGMLANAAFLWLWRALPPYLPSGRLEVRLATMVGLSLLGWGVLAALCWLLLDAVRSAGGSTAWVGGGALALTVGVGVVACLQDIPAPGGRRSVGPVVLAARGVVAAVAIGGSAALALAGSDLVAGIASVFPAIFLTTMVSLWWSQGEAVPTGAVGPMMLGSSAVGAFALLAAWLLPALGPVAGAAVAWILSAAGVTVPATLWLRRRRARSVRTPG